MITRFNIRVYFLLSDGDPRRILLSDEVIQGGHYSKFPGGGLEFGEGPEDAAKREAIEELGQEIQLEGHIHTTPFFQESRFLKGHQVICIYYKASLKEPQRFRTSNKANDFPGSPNPEESFRWVSVNSELIDELSFPTDKAALQAYIQLINDGSGTT